MKEEEEEVEIPTGPHDHLRAAQWPSLFCWVAAVVAVVVAVVAVVVVDVVDVVISLPLPRPWRVTSNPKSPKSRNE